MIKIEHPVFPSPEQWMFAIEGARNAYDSWHLSDSYIGHTTEYDKERNVEIWHPCFCMGEKDLGLFKRLARAGKDHRKALRSLPVGLRITFHHTWWAQADTYKVGTTRCSCSKMHTIHKKEFDLDSFSHEGIDVVIEKFSLSSHDKRNTSDIENTLGYKVKQHTENTIQLLNELKDEYNATKDKSIWNAILEMLPMGYNITANLSLTYEVLLNMYFSRKTHPVKDWRIFCQWMLDNVPYFKDLVEHIEWQNKVSAKAV